jgi:hypothetical protein
VNPPGIRPGEGAPLKLRLGGDFLTDDGGLQDKSPPLDGENRVAFLMVDS